LRKGFADALKDAELLAEAQKANLEINPLYPRNLGMLERPAVQPAIRAE
jgi:hypothetical protein